MIVAGRRVFGIPGEPGLARLKTEISGGASAIQQAFGVTPRWYRGASVFVLSSRFEGLPLALLEAMAFGLPCVATDCRSGPSELLGGGAGILVPVDDAPRLSSAMLSVLRDEALRGTLSAHGRSVAASFSIELLVHRWISLLDFAS